MSFDGCLYFPGFLLLFIKYVIAKSQIELFYI